MVILAKVGIPESVRADLWEAVKDAFNRYMKHRSSDHPIDKAFGWAQGELNMAVAMYSIATGQEQCKIYETLEDIWINQ